MLPRSKRTSLLPLRRNTSSRSGSAYVKPALTVKLKLADPVFPLPSLAVQVTVVTPSGKLLPEAGVQAAPRLPTQTSLAVGPKKAIDPALVVGVRRVFAGSLPHRGGAAGSSR